MALVFICYRREDSGYAGRVCAWLKGRLGEDQVFMDVEGIGLGEDYFAVLHRRIAEARLVLVLLSPGWVHAADREGRRRLERADDAVRIEIETAISRGAQMIPVLVGGAAMPSQAELPESIAGLARLNALEVSDKFFDRSMEYLAQNFVKWGISSAASPAGMWKKKVCLLGEFGVGKTSLVRSFVHSMFSDSYITTVGVKIDKKIVTVGDYEVTLFIWDMAGEEDGFPVKLNQLRDASGVFLVADGCRSSTLDTAMRIRRRVYDEIGPLPTVLAVNKVDLVSEWQVRFEELESYSRIGTTVFTTSARTGKGVEQMFAHLTREIVAADAAKPDDDE